jgi:hypothetical protein
VREHDNEPVPGLPEHLPAGERILWQGRPVWTSLAIHAFHVRKVAAYFGLLLAWRGIAAWQDGQTAGEALWSAVKVAPIGLAGLALVLALAWLYGRTSLFTITSRRIVLRTGVALPMSLNIPFRVIGSADLRVHADGTGDLPVAIVGPDRIAYLHLWPFARRWRLRRPEPMLRSVPEAATVAGILGRALREAAGDAAQAPIEVSAAPETRAPEPPFAAAAA